MNARAIRLSLSFVVPALNEGEAVAETVAEIVPVGERHCEFFEIVLVDDASTDETGRVMDRVAAADRRIRTIHNPANIGFGGSYKRGVAAASGDFVMVVPGDNSFPASSLDSIVERVGEADLVIPYPTNPGARSRMRRIGSAAFTLVANTLFGLRVPYYNGLVVYRRRDYANIQVRADGFFYQAEGVVKMIRAGRSFVTVPTVIRERTSGRSSALKPANIGKTLMALGRLAAEVYWPRRRPRS